MIVFFIGLILLLWMLLGFARVLRTPSAAQPSSSPRLAQNKAAYFERERELAEQQRSGEIDAATYSRLHAENARVLLADAGVITRVKNSALRTPSNLLTLLLALFVLAGSAALYAAFGSWSAVRHWHDLTAASEQGQQSPSTQDNVEDMMLVLRSRLHDDPDDADGWLLLGRSWLSLGQPKLAVQAFNRARTLAPKNADYWVAYAQALRVSDAAALKQVDEALRQALFLNPEHEGARLFHAYRLLEQQQFDAAITIFTQLKTKYADNPEAVTALEQALHRARSAQAEAGANNAADSLTAVPVTTAPAIAVTVSAAPELLASLPASSRVFIYARALQGPAMPIAIIDTTLGQLPLTVHLSDAQAMAGLKLSAQKDVRVIARASRSGQAQAQAGDWEASAELLNWPAHPSLRLHIQAPR